MNNSKLLIAPSILSADFANLKNEINKVESAGADFIHIDVMDGHFVPNITIGASVVKALRPYSNLVFDCHLMISEPDKYIDDFVKAGADIITFHYEATRNNTKNIIDKIKSSGIKAGLSVKPNTPISEVEKYIDDIDLFLVMTVEPGFGGQKFIDECANKIIEVKEKAKHNLIIQVDGGINEKTAKICADNGADCLVAGSYIYKSDDINEAIKKLRFLS